MLLADIRVVQDQVRVRVAADHEEGFADYEERPRSARVGPLDRERQGVRAPA
jgi:hypothetical protein